MIFPRLVRGVVPGSQLFIRRVVGFKIGHTDCPNSISRGFCPLRLLESTDSPVLKPSSWPLPNEAFERLLCLPVLQHSSSFFGAAVLVPKAKDVAAVFGFVAGGQSTFRWGDVSCDKVSGLL